MIKPLLLDVGCGNATLAKGSVNVDCFREGQNLQMGTQLKGEYVDPRRIPNFMVADACHLPFRNGVFDEAFSSHTIEHVQNPFLMYRELCRVSKRRVVVRCPHRRGSGAKRPFHINYLDEEWFNTVSKELGIKGWRQFANRYEGLSAKLSLPKWMKSSIFWRVFSFAERNLVRYKVPFDLEVWGNLEPPKYSLGKVRFVVVSNNMEILNRCFYRGKGVTKENSVVFNNINRVGIPVFYNQAADDCKDKDVWLVFCHQDFRFDQDISEYVKLLDVNGVYGVIGVREGLKNLIGSIKQYDDTRLGLPINSPEPVQTLDECCLIVHSSLFKKGLRFDEVCKFHFYGADLCMQAFTWGFGVYAVQLDCKHDSSKNQLEILGSKELVETQRLFAKKWQQFLPIRTTCVYVTANEINSSTENLLVNVWYKFFPKSIKLKIQGTK